MSNTKATSGSSSAACSMPCCRRRLAVSWNGRDSSNSFLYAIASPSRISVSSVYVPAAGVGREKKGGLALGLAKKAASGGAVLVNLHADAVVLRLDGDQSKP